MKLTIILLMMCLSISTYGRQPAVESFVGVEPSGYIERAPSSEKPYNFENNKTVVTAPETKTTLKSSGTGTEVKNVMTEMPEIPKEGFSLPYFFILACLITLPFAVWQMVISSLERKKASTSNIVSFPDKKKDDDDNWKKKAS